MSFDRIPERIASPPMFIITADIAWILLRIGSKHTAVSLSLPIEPIVIHNTMLTMKITGIILGLENIIFVIQQFY